MRIDHECQLFVYTSQNINYYRYKLHTVCSINGAISSFYISKASVHIIHYLQDVKSQFSDIIN